MARRYKEHGGHQLVSSGRIPNSVLKAAKEVSVDNAFEHRRLVFAAKSECSRGTLWEQAQDRLRKELRVGRREGKEVRNGWRKCHTEHYWAYYATYILEPFDDVQNNITFQPHNRTVAKLTDNRLTLLLDDEAEVHVDLHTGAVDAYGADLGEAAWQFWRMVELAKEVMLNAQQPPAARKPREFTLPGDWVLQELALETERYHRSGTLRLYCPHMTYDELEQIKQLMEEQAKGAVVTRDFKKIRENKKDI